jgi:hypothetical protein
MTSTDLSGIVLLTPILPSLLMTKATLLLASCASMTFCEPYWTTCKAGPSVASLTMSIFSVVYLVVSMMVVSPMTSKLQVVIFPVIVRSFACTLPTTSSAFCGVAVLIPTLPSLVTVSIRLLTS